MHIQKSKGKLLILSLAVMLAASCQKAMDYFPKGGETGKRTIAQLVGANEDYRLLKLALARTGLLDDLNGKGPFTVFAPNNKAFAAAGLGDAAAIAKVDKETLKSILLYHVVGAKIKAGDIPVADNTPVKSLNGKDLYVTKKNGKVCVNGVMVTIADIDASNGVIHAVDRVILPPSGTIVDVALGNPNFSILVEAVKYASTGSTNVLALLSGAGPLTVFAPTNKAFQDIGLSSLDDLKKFTPDQVTGILAYHVIGARVYSCNLVDGSKPTTVNGATLTVSLTAGPQVLGNGNGGNPSNILATDISATNGVIHVIDRVLLP
jgi:uncharacterized surface protein with fasciclin (FAS1) repeats